MALTTKPRWDKYDGYVGNFRGVLGADVDLDTESNKVLGVGLNSDGAVVVGSGQTGIKGLMIVAVGADIHGNLLDGGINNMTGDIQDVGKHGEITNFVPSDLTNDFVLTVIAGSGNITLNVKNSTTKVTQETGNIAYNALAAAVKTGIVAVDDSLLADDVTVTGTAPDFVVTLPEGYELLEVDTDDATVATSPASLTSAAGTNYYAHADGSVTSTKGSGIYVGHTVEADRLIVNVSDATP